MTSDADREAARVREAYARRAERGLDARYDYWEPANLFIYQSRERALLALLRSSRMLPLDGRVLDVGCGDGAVLRDLIRYGAAPAGLCGIDLLEARVRRARELLPDGYFEVADAQQLRFADGEFDLVLGFTLLSSVVDPAARLRVAGEMLRVTKPGGLVVVYDFWTNPTNPDVRPVPRRELRRLFAGHSVTFRSTTLAPPIVRLLTTAPGGWLACTLLEMLPFLRTHYVAAIRR
jgi:ubiquinone/menaquinone biosynthesis C-methylase UbiE